MTALEKQLSIIRTVFPKMIFMTAFLIGLVELHEYVEFSQRSWPRWRLDILLLIIIGLLNLLSVFLVNGNLTIRRLVYAKWIGAFVVFASVLWIMIFGVYFLLLRDGLFEYIYYFLLILSIFLVWSFIQQIRSRCHGYLDQYVEIGAASRKGFVTLQEVELVLVPKDDKVKQKDALWRSRLPVLSGVGITLGMTLGIYGKTYAAAVLASMSVLVMAYALTALFLHIVYFHRFVDNPDASIEQF